MILLIETGQLKKHRSGAFFVFMVSNVMPWLIALAQ
jgi:hypothetical protein